MKHISHRVPPAVTVPMALRSPMSPAFSSPHISPVPRMPVPVSGPPHWARVNPHNNDGRGTDAKTDAEPHTCSGIAARQHERNQSSSNRQTGNSFHIFLLVRILHQRVHIHAYSLSNSRARLGCLVPPQILMDLRLWWVRARVVAERSVHSPLHPVQF